MFVNYFTNEKNEKKKRKDKFKCQKVMEVFQAKNFP